MTNSEQIEQLKLKLEQTTGAKEQAEILLDLLDKSDSTKSTDTQAFIDRLLQLAEKLNEPLYKAWGLHHHALLKLNTGDYDLSVDLSRQALSLFEKLNEGKGIANSYYNIGNIYKNQGKYPEALKNHFVALKIQEEIGDKPGIANSYNNIGNIYENQGKFPEALKYYFTSLKIRQEFGDKRGTARSYNNIGIVYKNQGNYPEALKYYFAALKIFEEIVDKRGIAASYNNIGIVYYHQGNYPNALKNYFAALKIREEIGDKSGVANSHINIGEFYENQGKNPEALKNHFTALKIFEEIGYKLGIAHSYIGIGKTYQRQGKYPEALKNHFTALKISEEIGYKRGIVELYYNIGKTYQHQGKYPKALKELLKALKLAEDTGIKDMVKESSLMLANTYKGTGDYESAFAYYEKFHEAEKEILGQEAQKELTNLSLMHELEKKEKDLEIEQLRNVELKKERDRSESLLLNILPAEVAEELIEKGTAEAKLFKNVTVFFSDFKGFTQISEQLNPQDLVNELHECFSAFDNIIHKYSIEKIKTVGDAYLAVSGLPIANPKHAEEIIKAALEIQEFMKSRISKAPFGGLGSVRIGIHSGHVVAGIVGIKKFAYDIWGDTVNTAARMEQNSEPGKVNISETTYKLVKNKFKTEYRGKIEAKGKGKVKMYFVI